MTTIGRYAQQGNVDFQSFAGPGDPKLRNSELEGYQPVSRIGEIVSNAVVDAYEFGPLLPQITGVDMGTANPSGDPVEFKPMFHEWATVTPGARRAGSEPRAASRAQRAAQAARSRRAGMICVSRKKRTAVFRQYTGVETAIPVVACAACLPKSSENDFFFAGVARSKSIRQPDDGTVSHRAPPRRSPAPPRRRSRARHRRHGPLRR